MVSGHDRMRWTHVTPRAYVHAKLPHAYTHILCAHAYVHALCSASCFHASRYTVCSCLHAWLLACAVLCRFCSWLERLRIEETASQFDRSRYEKQGFVLSTDSADPSVRTIRLEGIGPKMLVSDLTTAEAPLLRWRLELRGNNAVEFGTVPVALQV